MTPADPAGQAEGEGPSLRESSVGGHNIQIGSAGNISIQLSRHAGRPLLADPRRWLFGLGSAIVIVAAVLLWRSDFGKDMTGSPPLHARTSSRINVGDRLALPDKVASGSDQALLLRNPDDMELLGLLQRHKGARVGTMNVVIIIQGLRDSGIRLIDVRPRVIASGRSFTGTCIQVPAQGEVDEYQIKVDLDVQRPEGHPSRYLPKSIDLASGERVTIEFTVTAEDKSYEWDIEVVYDYGGRLRRAYFRGPDNEPFRITGPATRYEITYHAPTALPNGYRETQQDPVCQDR